MKTSRSLRKRSWVKKGQRRWLNIESLESRTLLSTYFVSTGGSDSAAGTSSSPWQTIQHAVGQVQAGDTVDVRAGNYAGFDVGSDGPVNGTASAPITFKAEPGAVINATNGTTSDGINVEDCSYIVIDGFAIQHTDGGSWRSGIRFGGGGTGNVARNNTVIMEAGDAMGIYSSFNINQVVENNEVSGNHDAGIYCSNSAVNPTVRNNYVHDLSPSTGQGVGIHFNGDVSMGGNGIINGGLIEGNKVYNCGTGISMDGMQNATVRNNLVLDIHGKGINLYQADASGGSKNDVVANNTVVLAADGYFPIGARDGSTNVKVLNNIGLGGSRAFVTDSSSSSGLVVDHNIWGTNAFSNDNDSSWLRLPDWQSGVQDVDSILSTASALFVNPNSNYHLLSNAPAVDAGTSTSAPTIDYDGNARPVGRGYDIGAFEYGGGSTPAPTAPNAPSALSATANSSSQVTLTWNDNSSNETGFTIERQTGGGSFVQLATVGAGVTGYIDGSLSASSSYSYRVTAANSVGDSAYSNVATVTTPAPPVTQTTPASPDHLAATAKDLSTITLTWTDNSNNEANFRIDRSSDGLNFTQIATVPANSTSYTDTGLSPNTTYTYRARAYNDAGNSYWCDNAQATTPVHPTAPAAPGNLSATATASENVNVSWTDNSANESGFVIEQSTAGGSFTRVGTVSADITSFAVTDLTAGTQYSYRVLAYNDSGSSSYSNTVSVTTLPNTSDPDPTTPPVSAWPLSAIAGAGKVGLSWVDNSDNETGFRIDRASDGVNFSQAATLGADVTGWIDTSVAGGTTYTYRILAYNDAGNSYWSNLVNAIPTGDLSSGLSSTGDPTVPPVSAWPLQATGEQKDVLLTWTDSSDNETYFQIDRASDGANFTQAAVVAANHTNWVDPNVVSGVTYTYRIKAYNDAGSSYWSNLVEATLA